MSTMAIESLRWLGHEWWSIHGGKCGWEWGSWNSTRSVMCWLRLDHTDKCTGSGMHVVKLKLARVSMQYVGSSN